MSGCHSVIVLNRFNINFQFPKLFLLGGNSETSRKMSALAIIKVIFWTSIPSNISSDTTHFNSRSKLIWKLKNNIILIRLWLYGSSKEIDHSLRQLPFFSSFAIHSSFSYCLVYCWVLGWQPTKVTEFTWNWKDCEKSAKSVFRQFNHFVFVDEVCLHEIVDHCLAIDIYADSQNWSEERKGRKRTRSTKNNISIKSVPMSFIHIISKSLFFKAINLMEDSRSQSITRRSFWLSQHNQSLFQNNSAKIWSWLSPISSWDEEMKA